MVYKCKCVVKCQLLVDAENEVEAEFMAYDYLYDCELLDAECECEEW